MATGSDVRDILQLEDQPASLSRREVLFGADKPKRKSNAKPLVKKPEGLSREVWGLLYSDSRDPPPIVPTDNAAAGYKQAKIKLGVQRVRPWTWTPFINPARKDGLVLNHWRRVADEGKEYPFAKFNKEVEIPNYSDAEYAQHLHDENWSKEETDHLFDLASGFDLRFVIMQDRYDVKKFSKRSVEDLKERYYEITGKLQQIRSSNPGAEEVYVYDAEHERKRKEQLRRLCDRTPEEIEEEQSLIAEMRKIKQREKDREKRTGDIQKLLSKAADVSLSPTASSGRGGAQGTGIKGAGNIGSDSPNGAANEARRGPDGKKSGHQKKKGHHSSPLLQPKARASATDVSSSVAANASATLPASLTKDSSDPSTTSASAAAASSSSTTTSGIRFSEYKTSGVTLRSQRIKLPSSVGQKKTKAIESMLLELGIEVNPVPTEEIGEHFNDLRSEMVLHYDLKSALQNSEFEVQTLMHRKQAIVGGDAGITLPKAEDASEAAVPEVAEDASMDKGVEEVKTEVEEEDVKEGEEDLSGRSGGGGGGGGAAAAVANTSSQKQPKKGTESSEVPTQKKRKAFLEQKNVMNKLKNR